MNTRETNSLNAIDKAIADLQKTRETLLANMPLSSRVTKNDWVIDTRTNSHYQFNEIRQNIIGLVRHTGGKTLAPDVFNTNFVLATTEQVENHLRYLNKRGFWYVGQPIQDASGSIKSIPADSLGEHIQKLCKASRKEVQVPEFYMITVEGKSGAIVRHPDFQTAVTEATRLAKKCNHRAHIMGVVGIIEPVEVQKPITEYQLIQK